MLEVTVCYLIAQTCILIIFARHFMPDLSWIGKQIFGEKEPSPREKETRERIARQVAFDQAYRWHKDCIAKHTQQRRK